MRCVELLDFFFFKPLGEFQRWVLGVEARVRARYDSWRGISRCHSLSISICSERQRWPLQEAACPVWSRVVVVMVLVRHFTHTPPP